MMAFNPTVHGMEGPTKRKAQPEFSITHVHFISSNYIVLPGK
jgi:hypothetical protein